MTLRLASTILLFAVLCSAADDLPAPPASPKKPVTDEYGTFKIIDDYRWLESAADPAVKQWSDQQNSRTRYYLDHLPQRAGIAERLGELYNSISVHFSSLTFRGGTLFAIKTQ